MNNKVYKVLSAIFGATIGYSLIDTLTSEPVASLYPTTTGIGGELTSSLSSEGTGDILSIVGGTSCGYATTVTGAKAFKGNLTMEDSPEEIMDEKAQKVYDKYHKNHKPIEASGILFENDEVKKEFYRILNSYEKKELYYHLRALEELLTEAIEEENSKKLILK